MLADVLDFPIAYTGVRSYMGGLITATIEVTASYS